MYQLVLQSGQRMSYRDSARGGYGLLPATTTDAPIGHGDTFVAEPAGDVAESFRLVTPPDEHGVSLTVYVAMPHFGIAPWWGIARTSARSVSSFFVCDNDTRVKTPDGLFLCIRNGMVDSVGDYVLLSDPTDEECLMLESVPHILK